MSSRAPATVTNHNLTKNGIACPQVRSGRLPPSCRLEMFAQAATEITDLSWSQSQHISDVKKNQSKRKWVRSEDFFRDLGKPAFCSLRRCLDRLNRPEYGKFHW